MLYAFTDESYVAASYLQGAFVIDETDIGQLDQILISTSEFAQRFGIAPGTELRGYSIMNSKHGWEPLRNKFHARVAIYKFLLTKVAELDGILCFASEFLPDSNFESISNYSRHIATHDHLLDKLNLLGLKFEKGVVIYADEITAQQKIAKDFKTQIHRYPNLNSLNFVDSETNAGVQIIDVILYLYQRFEQEKTLERRSKKVTIELWELVKQLCVE